MKVLKKINFRQFFLCLWLLFTLKIMIFDILYYVWGGGEIIFKERFQKEVLLEF